MSRKQIRTRGCKQITWPANVDLGSGRDAGTKTDDATCPPASQHPVGRPKRPTLTLADRQFVCAVQNDTVCLVEVRRTVIASQVVLILEEAGGLMSSLTRDDFWADTLWQRSAIAARDPSLFDAWKRWIRARR